MKRCLAFSLLTFASVVFAVDTARLDEPLQQATAPVLAAYQHLHRHPELGKKEAETARFVRQELEQLGYTTFYELQDLPTAVVALLETGRPGPVTCLRADLDALRVDEAPGLAFASETPGLMHACGHDAHSAMLLGAARVLRGMQDALCGTVVFLFQPAEETAGGADEIVEAGMLKTLGVTRMFAQHVRAGLAVGDLQLSAGPVMAGSTTLKITVTGDGGHAARPWESDDVLRHAAGLVTDLSAFPARELDLANRPCVISLTSFHSGRATNVLPDSAEIGGTVRSFEYLAASHGAQPSLQNLITNFAERQAAADGVTADCRFIPGAPPLVNDSALYAEIAPQLVRDWPAGRIGPAQRTMAAEDFAFYTPECPCLFVSTGIARDTLGWVGVHQSGFTLHPDVLPQGVRLLVMLALYSNSSGEATTNTER